MDSVEGLQSAFRSAISQAQDSTLSNTISSAFEKAKASINSSGSPSSSSALSDSTANQPPPLLLTRAPRNMVSSWTCSKLCAVFFVAGVFVGYTLKRRVRRWVSKLLRRLKDE